ncbi:MAG TPA: iron-sulfur cluster repair di-iron protein [Burkholderiales bacterium]|nr:iron-sulfur cluster repair di-iron protein [Burkholderiales bacterium]
MNATPHTPVGQVVAADYRAAAVFSKYGIDFCCGGGRSIEESCQAQGVNPDQVIGEVLRVCEHEDASAPKFTDWDAPALIDHIISKHHAYVRRALPALAAYTAKLSTVHGPNHPELLEVERIVEDVVAEMTSHMMKEEQILFPYVTGLATAAATHGTLPGSPFGSVGNPIRMMEDEHESAGNALARIRELTGDYAPPPDACTTYRVCLQELEAFEQDLHAHVHLENNILFPKALRLETELASAARA